MANSAADVYKKTNVETANQGELIMMLYNGAIRFLDEAISAVDDYKKYDAVNENIIKATNIINELRTSLDMKVGDIANKLDSIYEYMLRTLLEANTEKSREKLEEIRSYLKELSSSWQQIASGKINPGSLGLKAGGFSLKG